MANASVPGASSYFQRPPLHLFFFDSLRLQPLHFQPDWNSKWNWLRIGFSRSASATGRRQCSTRSACARALSALEDAPAGCNPLDAIDSRIREARILWDPPLSASAGVQRVRLVKGYEGMQGAVVTLHQRHNSPSFRLGRSARRACRRRCTVRK